ncbi:hypothetical protein ACO0RG_000057 [Hanseniaspora osmophila]|uniref:Uncharacterized protein n=1 Tax=Hanseniaspora osmophila TaxID=56408 RepID=A0A1E5R5H1_9ASCO|nr:hypothetical protein AWRI3579_g3548 [Hanseniaspora osmophila]
MSSNVSYGNNDQDEQLDYYTEYLENSTGDMTTKTCDNNENINNWTQQMYDRSITEQLSSVVQQKMNQPLQRNTTHLKRNREEEETDSAPHNKVSNSAHGGVTSLNSGLLSHTSGLPFQNNNMQSTYTNEKKKNRF